MRLKWRGKNYTFTPRTLVASKDKDGAGAKVTIDANIYAFDTESVALPDRYEPICFQISGPDSGESLTYLPPHAKTLEVFIDEFIKRFSWKEYDNHYCFMYAHNLAYDWNQIIKGYPDLMAISRTGIGFKEDYTIYEKEDYKVILRKGGLFVGSAPHFTLQIRQSKREWFDLMFRDTFSFFPVSLARISKDLGLVEKMERQEGLGTIDYRTLADDDPRKIYFEKYGKIDALATRLTAEKIRDLHRSAGMSRVRVSAPGYAINKLFHGIPEGTEIIQGPDDVEIMQLILDSYAGGRTGGVHHGQISNVSVLDFHSSYPASMLTLPSFGPTMDYIRYPDPENLTTDELLEMIDECHLFARVDGEETDARYPALIKSVNNKLVPIYGKFENVATTGVELSVGIRSGTLRIDRINELVLLVEMEEPKVLPFKVFVLDAYARKQYSAKGSSDYISAKLELNATYGKLIESRRETSVADDVGDIILPYIEGQETEFGHIYYTEYINSIREDSTKSFIEGYTELVDGILDTLEGMDVKYSNFNNLSLTELEYGRYVVPAGASLITATSRARLLAMAKGTGALYWDTDSIFIIDYDPIRLAPDLERASDWLPAFIQRLSIGEYLGELDAEITGASGYLAGTKRYYLVDAEGTEKKALHGIPTAPFDIAEKIIKSLATGDNFNYEGRQRPKGIKETKKATEVGRFFSRSYEAQFHLDTRLDWEETAGGWSGRVKRLSDIEK
jgi:hypothetical protein